MFIYLFLKESERTSGGGRERERERERERQRQRQRQNPKQAPGSRLSAHSPTRDSNAWTVRSWPKSKIKTWTLTTEPPRCPEVMRFYIPDPFLTRVGSHKDRFQNTVSEMSLGQHFPNHLWGTQKTPKVNTDIPRNSPLWSHRFRKLWCCVPLCWLHCELTY